MRLYGSSPRVRGTHFTKPFCYIINRFIPACAGNAVRESIESDYGSVHPRVCGERITIQSFSWDHAGSSPRVRGTPLSSTSVMFKYRFIPACAGNAKMFGVKNTILAVHPRVCGERTVEYTSDDQLTGSSPRVRGTRWKNWINSLILWFIPACAGNAHQSGMYTGESSVHPRVCGERF